MIKKLELKVAIIWQYKGGHYNVSCCKMLDVKFSKTGKKNFPKVIYYINFFCWI